MQGTMVLWSNASCIQSEGQKFETHHCHGLSLSFIAIFYGLSLSFLFKMALGKYKFSPRNVDVAMR